MMTTAQTFPCPNCREFINDQMRVCRYCNAPVDPQAAAEAVARQDTINRACNSASLARSVAGVMWLLFFLRLIPMLAAAGLGVIGGLVAIPVWVIFWVVRYGGIRTEDVDYKRARRNIASAAALWALLVVAHVVVRLFVAV